MIVSIVTSSQQQAMYVDDELRMHAPGKISIDAGMRHLVESKTAVTGLAILDVNEQWLEMVRKFPQRLEDVVFSNETFEIVDT